MTAAVEAKDVIRILVAEKGYREGYSNGHWNNNQKFSTQVPGLEWSNWQAWCATFCVWGAHKAGDATIMPVYAGCALQVATYKQWKRFSWYPAVGAQVFFGESGGTHTGLVTRWDDTTIWTIEGNTNDSGSPEGNGVYEKSYRRDNPRIYGYGYPKYAHAMDSADPEWKEPGKLPETPVPAPPPKPTPVPPKPTAPAFPGRQFFVLGAKNAYAKQLQTWLHKGGWGPRYILGPSQTMTKKDLEKVKALQNHFLKDLGPADGLTGPKTWQYAWEVANGLRKK
ncbi:CHAP domain-containing protein [Streptomyces sp. NPDC088752]|uniref:CHAP domain-containing protein n=1 Tax=Streptomyces sp. NPDC088752 TaxID=3154963 RepID=UPI003439DBFC